MADLWFPYPFPRGQNYAPGTILPYTLPNVDVEPPFEKISWYATEESGRFPPVNAEKLREFLKFLSSSDYRKQKIKTALKEALVSAHEVDKFYMQLYNLRSRMNQIGDVEKERNDFLQDRIERVEEGLTSENYPDELRYDLVLSKVAEEALRRAGGKGPLEERQLRQLIRTGKTDPKLRSPKLSKQLKDMRESIGHIAKREDEHFDSIVKVISKALDHIDSVVINAKIL